MKAAQGKLNVSGRKAVCDIRDLNVSLVWSSPRFPETGRAGAGQRESDLPTSGC